MRPPDTNRKANSAEPGSPTLPVGNRVHFQGRLPEARASLRQRCAIRKPVPGLTTVPGSPIGGGESGARSDQVVGPRDQDPGVTVRNQADDHWRSKRGEGLVHGVDPV